MTSSIHALQTHRRPHALWNDGRKDFALSLQDGASEVFQVDIHCPRIGAGSVVLADVPRSTTQYHRRGVPARVIGHAGCAEPSRLMDQVFYDVGL